MENILNNSQITYIKNFENLNNLSNNQKNYINDYLFLKSIFEYILPIKGNFKSLDNSFYDYNNLINLCLDQFYFRFSDYHINLENSLQIIERKKLKEFRQLNKDIPLNSYYLAITKDYIIFFCIFEYLDNSLNIIKDNLYYWINDIHNKNEYLIRLSYYIGNDPKFSKFFYNFSDFKKCYDKYKTTDLKSKSFDINTLELVNHYHSFYIRFENITDFLKFI